MPSSLQETFATLVAGTRSSTYGSTSTMSTMTAGKKGKRRFHREMGNGHLGSYDTRPGTRGGHGLEVGRTSPRKERRDDTVDIAFFKS